jgi:FXSXX-COOH protein
MTPPPTAPTIETGLLRTLDLPLAELAARHAAGDSALAHCLRRVVEQAASGTRATAAFNAAPLRRK